MTADPRRFSLPPATSSVRSSSFNEQRDPVELLAGEFVDRLRRGEAVTVEQYARKFPQLASTIRSLFPTIAAMEGLRGFMGPGSSNATPDLQLQRLGDFRIVRELGRGGMGIVYEAEQESLCRRVAVKVLSPKLLASDKHVARFRVEAQTAANLHHTNIVPVFGVGEHEGLHYYVMQFIDGAGLDQASHTGSSDRTPTLILRSSAGDTPRLAHTSPDSPIVVTNDNSIAIPATTAERIRWAVDVARQVARALQFAHEQGVLHRDIKPGNLLLDAQGVVRVTDFGLATVVDEERESATQEIVGTLRYMAPEQFVSKVDARSDIYSLGITLYELIAAAPAFVEPNKSKLIAQVRQGLLQPLRKRVPEVSRDLAAIVARATAVDPGRRYQSAAQFADDLERCLERRPVQARPISAAARLGRWALRNPWVATLHGCVILLLASIALVSSVGYKSVQASLERESIERQRADSNSRMASETLDRIFSRFDPPTNPASSGDDLGRYDDASQPILSPETAAMMQNLLRYYDELASQASDDPALRRKAAAARRRVGDIRQRLGDYDTAIVAYAEARARQNELSAEGLDVRGELARIHNELGRCYVMLDRLADARAAHTTALGVLEKWQRSEPQNRNVLYELARTHYLLGRSIRPGQSPSQMPMDMFVNMPSVGGPGERRGPRGSIEWDDLSTQQRAGERRPPPDDAPPGPPRYVDVNPPHLYAAIKVLRTVVTDTTVGPPAFRQLLAACYRELAHDHLLQRTSADLAAERNAIDLLEGLTLQSPRNADYRYDLMETLAQIDVFSAPVGTPQFDEALKNLTAAQEHAEQLMQDRPDVAEYTSAVIHVYFKLGTLQQSQGALERGRTRDRLGNEALRSFRRAASLERSLMVRHPDQLAYRAWLVRFLLAEAAILHRQNETERASKLLAEVDNHVGRLTRGTSAEQMAPLVALVKHQKESLKQAESASTEPPERFLPPFPGGPGGPGGRRGPGPGSIESDF